MVKQGYKQTEIGVIPEDWEVKELVDMVELINGRAYSQNELLSRGKYRVLRVGNFFSSDKWYWSDLELSNKFYVENGDLMYAWSASFGPKFWFDEKTIYHYHIWKIDNYRKTDKKFLYHLLVNDKASIQNESQGGTMFHITKEAMEKRKFPLPPLPEQEAIAEALSDADAWIESLEQLIAKKRLIKQGAMQELLTPRDDWESKSLFEIADKKRDLFNDGDWIESEHIIDEGIRLVQTGNIGIGKFLNKGGRKYISEKSFNDLKCKEIKEGDLLICRLAEPAGRACIFPKTEDYKSVTSVDVTIFRPDVQKYSREFLMYTFCTNEWFTDIIEKVGGTTHKRISRGNLGGVSIKIPSLSEQTRIASILSDMDAEIEVLEQKLSKARQIKQGMMQELLTGRTRLV